MSLEKTESSLSDDVSTVSVRIVTDFVKKLVTTNVITVETVAFDMSYLQLCDTDSHRRNFLSER